MQSQCVLQRLVKVCSVYVSYLMNKAEISDNSWQHKSMVLQVLAYTSLCPALLYIFYG